MIWNSKLALVREAIIQNPFGSDKFVWNDIGSLRESRFIHENYMCNNFDIAKLNGYYFVQRQN
jgi:hypothetical protein